MAFALRRGARFPTVPTVLVLLLGACWFLAFRPHWARDGVSSRPPAQSKGPAVEIVVASMKHENTSWVQQHLPDWSHKIYVVNDPTSPLTVKVNKGREAMVYLTHIIDQYHDLADTTVFMHASRFQWHNDDPDYDALPGLRRLNTDYVQSVGYANLRCVWVLGCPVEIRPFDDELPAGQKAEGALTTKQIYKQAFSELLPDVEVPREVGISCCSQFAVSKDTIYRRPRADYVRYRQWLVDTPLTDDLSGRVLEYAFHSESGSPLSPPLPSLRSKHWPLFPGRR